LDAIKGARFTQGRRSAGSIELAFEVENGAILLSWSDDGCGMSEETRANAFVPFFTTKDTGSGLGLFVTKTIIEQHGGYIVVQSTSDSGTCLHITLPLFHATENRNTALN